MSLLKPIQNGRMYPGWWRWNPIAGCLHDCSYCYMKTMSKRCGKDMMTPTGLREEYLNDILGSGKKIFVGSSGDMWGKWVQSWRIDEVLWRCRNYTDNEYMFLTKNPERYAGWRSDWRALNCILGATIETDLTSIAKEVGNAPDVLYRLARMKEAREMCIPRGRTMISIEPVVQFSPDFAARLKTVASDIIYIGVDSGKNGLPEPSPDELQGLIDELRAFTDVRLKAGIERLLPDA